MPLTTSTRPSTDHPIPQCPTEIRRTNSPVEHLRICHGLVSRADADASILAWAFVYLRLVGSRQTRHEMRANYQTKDISHIQDVFSLALSKAYADTYARGSSEGALERALIRSMVPHVPRGGGNGDELRLFILDLMRRHGIREGHRPGIDDPFLEQWHQKLHSASTPEDIAICEAYIAFQETGSHHDFFRALWERGRLTTDDLKNLPQPLTQLPRRMPQLVPDLRHLLWILKQIHAGSENLHYLIEVSRWQLDPQTTALLESIRDNFGAWWIPGKIVEARKKLQPRLTVGTPRDPLMLDVALDGIFKTSVERLDLRALGKEDLTELAVLSLENLVLSYDDERTGLCRALWERVRRSRAERGWSRRASLQAFAAVTSVRLFVQAYSGLWHRTLQPKAQAVGSSYEIDPSYVANFAEEVIRSQGVFCAAKIADALAPRLRDAAGVGPWTIVSRGDQTARGRISVARSLSTACERPAPTGERRILVVNEVDGTEDLPDWVAAIITSAEVDLLSHVAIRARASGVLLATCYDDGELSRLRQREEALLHLRVNGDNLEITDTPELAPESARRERLQVRTISSSKSANLARLAKRQPKAFELPAGAVLDAEVFSEALHGAPQIAAQIRRLESKLVGRIAEDRTVLAEIRETISHMPLTGPVVEAIRARLSQAGLIARDSGKLWKSACHTVAKVWASVWNDRAHWSRVARGVKRESVRMGVLVQKAVAAEQAFVVHTRHPVSDDPRQMLVEIVVGLGDTLAANAPGSPLRAVVSRDARSYEIVSFPSKPFALRNSAVGGTLIVRSDCNDEDQAGFSGAGLYDSYLVDPPSVRWISYAGERLFWDEAFQHELLARIVDAAESVEEIMGAPQDIEGAFCEGRVYVVQTRNQTDTVTAQDRAADLDRLEARGRVG